MRLRYRPAEIDYPPTEVDGSAGPTLSLKAPAPLPQPGPATANPTSCLIRFGRNDLLQSGRSDRFVLTHPAVEP